MARGLDRALFRRYFIMVLYNFSSHIMKENTDEFR